MASWYYEAAIPGDNPLKMRSSLITDGVRQTLRASTAVVLNNTIPRILFHEALKPFREKRYHFSEDLLCREAVLRAKQLLDNKKNY
ncbi:hypothetical protein PC123_g17539 [Phytophthora cactorum]|nr:hypothetical protein PC123_g17539 [Phytophthora cactorum]